jgi:hypothetical protein
MKELEVKEMLADSRIPEQYKCGGRLSSEFLDGVDYAEQRIMEKGVEIWLARNEKGYLHAHLHKPTLNHIGNSGGYWCDRKSSAHLFQLDSSSFPEVTFENSPVKAQIILED